MTLLLFSYLVSICCILPLCQHPLSLMLNVFFAAVTTGLLTALHTSSWFGYILVLVFVGGLLVMFSYVTALASNEKFTHNTNRFLAYQLCAFAVVYTTARLTLSPPIIKTFGQTEKFPWINEQLFRGMELTSYALLATLIGLAIFLMITLIFVVKICYTHASKRSLRSF